MRELRRGAGQALVLAFVVLFCCLSPARAQQSLGTLRGKVAELDRELQSESGPPRLFLVESEYLRAVTSAELEWVSGVLEDLRSGELTWSYEELARLVRHFLPPEERA